ncbi:MAG: glycosyltransferase family 2 protein [Chloroflexi bacterium]|nr:glycosyltransferase family 2 protein [Chloroflexota bacterium]
MPEVSVIIVNFNVHDLLGECLRSLFASEGVDFQVCVVDNCSADGSATMVKSEFPQVSLIERDVNGGYASANNIGLRWAGFGEDACCPERERETVGPVGHVGRVRPSPSPTPDPRPLAPAYVLLLNPDTVLPPDGLRKMLDFMEARPEAGIAGPKLVRPDGSLDLACRRSFPSPEVSFYRMLGLSRRFPGSRRFARYNLTYLDPNQSCEVDSVVGAFMLVRREAIEQAGLLDESFFMYGEDLDWAFRIKEKGWKVVYCPEVTVVHHKGASSRQRSYRATVEFYRAMLIFYRKHYAKQTFFLMGWLIVGAIYAKGMMAYIRNLLRPEEFKRVS